MPESVADAVEILTTHFEQPRADLTAWLIRLAEEHPSRVPWLQPANRRKLQLLNPISLQPTAGPCLEGVSRELGDIVVNVRWRNGVAEDFVHRVNVYECVKALFPSCSGR